MLLDGDQHVAEHGRAARTGDREQVRESGDLQTEITARPTLPLVAERDALRAADVHREERARHRVEARREHQGIELVLGVGGAQAPRRNRLDRVRPDVDEAHGLPVERLVVAGVHAQALRAQREVLRSEHRRHVLILHDLVDLAPDEVGGGVVRLLVHEEVTEGRHVHQAAHVPVRLEALVTLLWWDLKRLRDGRGAAGSCGDEVLGLAAEVLEDLLVAVALGLRQRAVVGRDREVRRALEDRDRGRLLRDQRDRLDARRPRADHADALPREVDAVVRPLTRVVGVALEVLEARVLRHPGHREAARGHDAEACAEAITLVRGDVPSGRGVVVVGGGDAGVELHPVAQREPVRHEPRVLQELRLGCVALAPIPLALDLVRERVLVGEALDVAAGAGVAVPVPGPTDVRTGLDHLGAEPQLPHAVQHVDASEPSPHD